MEDTPMTAFIIIAGCSVFAISLGIGLLAIIVFLREKWINSCIRRKIHLLPKLQKVIFEHKD